jgi:hypothetical protein
VSTSERLSTGRRHIRAGSVHVSELIAKRSLPFVDLPDVEQEFKDNPPPDGLFELLETEEEAPASHRRPPSKAAQAAKIAVLGVASFVLCASIVYGSMINREHGESEQQAANKPAADISGEQALLPDLLNRAVPKGGIGNAEETARQPGPGAPAQASEVIENTGAEAPAAGPPAAEAPATEAVPSAAVSGSKKEVVEQFYRLVPSWPTKAYGLLDPNLGTDVTQFVQSWSTVSGLEVLDVQERGDQVLAVVRMRLPDGSHLRVQQLLDVANTAPHRILGAEILSAQRN